MLVIYCDGCCETDRAWMAGFIDGEGCLTIARQMRKGRPSPAYRVFITVSNTNRPCLEFFKTLYGGEIYNIHDRRKDKRGTNWAEAYDWYCPVSSSERLLCDLLPYLRLKQEQAKILLEFIRSKKGFARKTNAGRNTGSAPLTDEEINHREKLRVAVQLLNSKGTRARLQKGSECNESDNLL